MFKRIIKFLLGIFYKPKKVNKLEFTKTYSYITFDEYINEYKCSKYSIPVNIEKVKDFDGKLIEFNKGITTFDKIILELILKNEEINKYTKFNKGTQDSLWKN